MNIYILIIITVLEMIIIRCHRVCCAMQSKGKVDNRWVSFFWGPSFVLSNTHGQRTVMVNKKMDSPGSASTNSHFVAWYVGCYGNACSLFLEPLWSKEYNTIYSCWRSHLIKGVLSCPVFLITLKIGNYFPR